MRRWTLACWTVVALGWGGCSGDGAEAAGGTAGAGDAFGEFEAYPANLCVGEKQVAASTFCAAAFDAWARFEADDNARTSAIATAEAALSEGWDSAESRAAEAGADCADLALTASGARALIEAEVASVVAAIGAESAGDAECGTSLITAAGRACRDLLRAESVHVRSLTDDADSTDLADARDDAFTDLADAMTGTCASEAARDMLRERVDALTASVVLNTVVAAELDDTRYTALTPGPTDYLGRTYMPQCVTGSDYTYFARRGAENKLLIYYQGGGACWNGPTCSVPTCRTQPNEDLDEFAAQGFFDLDDERNPFRDWNILFVTYCTCDIHFGDASVAYDGTDSATQHVGFQNAKVVERWAREHFLNPEAVFVTGSSAGAYGAWFHGPLLHDVWPASQMHILADAGNGVITDDFLENEFSVWNFAPNLPDIPGVLEAIIEGGGMPVYSEAVATRFPDTNWAHYTAFYDGSPGGQSGFYNVMLNDGNPAGTLRWWDAACEFGELALAQSEQTFAAVPDNYRYYFGSGTEHTVFRFDKVYTDTTGGVPLLVDWVTAMLNSGPAGRDPAWTNVLCENCGVLLDGDPRPTSLEPPFIQTGPTPEVACN